jgi:uncharacterized protein (DUF2147 family)
MVLKYSLTIVASLLLSLARLEGSGIVGEWLTIDETTGLATSIVAIGKVADGEFEGRVIEILRSEKGPNPICEKCPGDRKGQPIKGMVIMWGFKEADNQTYTGGRILEPKTGKIYQARMSLEKDGKLKLRGYVGVSLLGRTQVWERAN